MRELPARIGKYQLEEFLGGGMSEVYRARDMVIGRTVAVKILTEAGCADENAKNRFLAEARMAGNISHENIIAIYDFGDDESGHPYMVMEFLRGEDLRHAIDGGRTGDLESKIKIAIQVTRALEYIHSQKIIHRDIKPENVHINNAGVVKLMDFGIAKTEGFSMTQAGYVLGTPYYMAPEQVTGVEITPQVDVYAFGIMLFELFTGSKPITGDSVQRIFYSILNEPLKLEPLYERGVPQSVCDLIVKCTAKNPEDRPLGFAAVRAELERVVAEQHAATVAMPHVPPSAAPASISEPERAAVSRRPRWMIPLIAAVLLLAAGGAVYSGLWPRSTNESPAARSSTLAKSIQTGVGGVPTGEMVLVPAGAFLFGRDKLQLTLPAFYVDKTEVTNAQYGAFCKASEHALPAGFPADKADFPVVNVTIADAHAYAIWSGKRLPTTREWEKAARGFDGKAYPWGDVADISRANIGSAGPRPVSDFAAGASPFGALQMVGNVWEFVEQLGTPDEKTLAIPIFRDLNPRPGPNDPWYMIRGQSFQEPSLDPDVLWDSALVPATFKGPNLGFRCVKDPQ